MTSSIGTASMATTGMRRWRSAATDGATSVLQPSRIAASTGAAARSMPGSETWGITEQAEPLVAETVADAVEQREVHRIAERVGKANPR
jgi:hypothetical protein